MWAEEEVVLLMMMMIMVLQLSVPLPGTVQRRTGSRRTRTPLESASAAAVG